ncbi:MAG: polysaccharide lyase 6 family protein [Rubripirellula sp.]
MNRLLCTAILAFLVSCPVLAKQSLVKDADAFKKSLKAATPGDEILLASGQWKDVELVAVAEGTVDSPITVRAQEPGKVIIVGNSRLRVAGQHVRVSGLRFHQAWHKSALMEFREDSKRSARDCQISDCEFVDCVNPPDEKYEFKYLSVYGNRNVVQRCRFSGKTNRGTTLVVWLNNEGGQHTIRDNHFGPRQELGKNGGETIRIGDSATAHQNASCIVERNLFEECNGEGEIVSNKSCENLYQQNVFLRCSGALTLRHGHRCTVSQNLFLGQKARGTGGVRVIGSDHVVVNNRFERLEGSDYRSALVLMNGLADSPANGYEPVQRALIAHNTFADCKRTIVVGADNDEKQQIAPVDCRFINNAIVSRRGPMIDLVSNATGTKWLGNVWYGDGELGADLSEGISRASSDPIKRLGERWRLIEASPLIDAAVTTDTLPKHDFAAQTRDSSPDVGCDEWPVATATWISGTRVGPSWSSVALDPDH